MAGPSAGDSAGDRAGDQDFDRPAPDERLWVHPSELPAEPDEHGRSHRPRMAIPITAGLAGLLAAVGVTALVWSPLRANAPALSTTSVPRAPGQATTLAGDSGIGPLGPSVLKVVAWSGLEVRYGSAVVYEPDGVVLTSAGLVDGAGAVEVVGPDGSVVRGEVLGSDVQTDLAVLRTELRDLVPLSFRNESQHLRVGEPCAVVGGGHSAQESPTVTTGLVAALGTVTRHRDGWIVGAIEIDARVDPTSAGGAVVDSSGELIGIITGAGGPSDARAFAVPAGAVHRVVDQLLRHGRVTYAWLGVATADGSDSVRGALVIDVVAGGPAAHAGLQPGDLVVALDDEPVLGMASLMRVVRDREPGEAVTLRLMREDEEFEVVVRLGTKP